MSTPILNETRFNQILDTWKSDNAKDDNRELIASINQIFRKHYELGDSMTELSVSPSLRDNCVTIQTLPKELFCYPPFNKYREIDLSNWGFHEIPETIFLNSELKFLRLCNNPITVLSKNIGNLQNLENLKICNTNLSSLPEEIGELHSLDCLELCGNQFDVLPNSLSKLQNLKMLNISSNRGEISQDNDLPKGLTACLHKLKNVEILGLYRNRLEELPEDLIRGLEAMKNLITLDLSKNGLRILPENLSFLTKLQKLNSLFLCENSLSELPSNFFSSLKDLKNLYIINLSDNRLRTLPDNFRDLGPEIRLLLSRNRFSRQEVERILNITREPGYQGPIVELSIQDYTQDLQKNSDEIVSELYRVAKLPKKQFHLKDSLELNSWLNRISELPEFDSATNKQLIAQKILAIVEEASINNSFKNIFYQIIDDASQTCGDRVALSLLYLDIHHRLESIDLTDMQALARFLENGIWTLDLLEQCAREKVLTLAGVDEIETYLAYPIHLKEALDIPIVQKEMLYFRCSGVTEEDLEYAKNFVLAQRNDKEKCLEFLITQEKWLEALRINYPSEMQNIEAEREEAASQENLDAEGYSKIQEEYTAKVSALSEKILLQGKTV